MPFVVKAETLGSDEPVAGDGQFEGNFAKSNELVRLPISDDLNPLPSNVFARLDPNALAIAIASFGIASVGIGLLHRPVSVENVHVIWKRGSFVPDDPRSDNW